MRFSTGKEKIEYAEYSYPIVSDSSMLSTKIKIGWQALGMAKLTWILNVIT